MRVRIQDALWPYLGSRGTLVYPKPTRLLEDRLFYGRTGFGSSPIRLATGVAQAGALSQSQKAS